jgi:trehalose synthase
MISLKNYERIVGKEVIDDIYKKAKKITGRRILCINSTYLGGGVAELLNSLVFLFNEVGLKFEWKVLHGAPEFFTVTKKIHNALQGERAGLAKEEKELYYETNKNFSVFTHIDHDLVVIHDPQPLPLINFYKKSQPWIFRIHIDLLSPNPKVWSYLGSFVKKYDHLVVSNERYKRKKLNVLQSIIYPAIDPLSSKNKPIPGKEVERYLKKFGISLSRPIISQISRFDKWKDPIGVLRIFELVRKKANCQLVLLGSFAADDPEGEKVFKELKHRAEKMKYRKDVKIISVEDSILVNCLQRASSAVIQKSLREGCGLTVSEALYKGTPVVASNTGGIPLQLIDGVNGFLHQPRDISGFAQSVLMLLRDDRLRVKFGRSGKKHVKNNFLVTKLLLDWLNLFFKYLK